MDVYETSVLAWLIGNVAAVVWYLAWFGVAGLCVARGALPRLGGLRWIAGAIALRVGTELASWPFDGPILESLLADRLGYSFTAKYDAVGRLVGNLFSGICLVLGAYGALGLLTDLSKPPEP